MLSLSPRVPRPLCIFLWNFQLFSVRGPLYCGTAFTKEISFSRGRCICYRGNKVRVHIRIISIRILNQRSWFLHIFTPDRPTTISRIWLQPQAALCVTPRMNPETPLLTSLAMTRRDTERTICWSRSQCSADSTICCVQSKSEPKSLRKSRPLGRPRLGWKLEVMIKLSFHYRVSQVNWFRMNRQCQIECSYRACEHA